MFGGLGNGFLADTWEWNGTAWSNVTPVTGSPPASFSPALAYDEARSRIVFFGSGPNSTHGTDTWEWDGVTWTNRTPASGNPSARADSGLVYNAARGHVVMFGGATDNNGVDDMWEWNGTTWTDVTAPSNTMQPRSMMANAYDAARAQILVFGGRNKFVTLGDTSTFAYQTPQPQAPEGCLYGLDGDGDKLVGCADPDCFGYCSPRCNPAVMSCTAATPRCGDGSCQPIETKRLCPGDCGAPAALCGDFVCDAPEVATTCPGDCT